MSPTPTVYDDLLTQSLARGHSVFNQPPTVARARSSYLTPPNCNCNHDHDYDRSKSRKRDWDRGRNSTYRTGDPMPTQSPAQKIVRLKSLVMKVEPHWRLPRSTPYFTMWEKPDDMITYISSLCNASTLYPYGRPIWTESKLMYYCFYHIRHLFKIPLEIYAIKNVMPWASYSLQHHSNHNQTSMRVTYSYLMPSLQRLRVWLQKCYEQEAEHECQKLCEFRGDINQLHMSRSEANVRPGNEKLYKPEEQAKANTRLIPTGAEGNLEIRPPPCSQTAIKEAEALARQQR